MCFDHSASFPQSLHSNSPLDISIKGQMIRDLLNLAGFVLPNAEDIVSSSSSSSSSTTRSASLLFRSRLAACTAPSWPSEGMVAGHSPAWSPLLRHLPYGYSCATALSASLQARLVLLLPCSGISTGPAESAFHSRGRSRPQPPFPSAPPFKFWSVVFPFSFVSRYCFDVSFNFFFDQVVVQ